MKEATITLKLSKELDVTKKNVTPLEAIFLVAEHHRNVGGQPVEVDKESIKDIVIEGKGADGKPTKRSRTVDEEADRLKTKYSPKKVVALLAQVREVPDDFAAALDRGLKVALPSGGALSETKLV